MEEQIHRPSPDALLNPRYDANFKAIFSDNNPLVSFGSAANKTEGGSQAVKSEQSLYLPPLR